ncbi:MAG: penicillin acylase family protein, partial [Gammaproteobacteria bacterium]|nr:penicillin acylase family protein [Gammaproteobacteria bacterium]
QLTWGQVNSTINAHPFTRKLPLLSNLLDMPEQPLAGCPYCIRVVYGLFGASERMAVSPGHLEQAIMHMPTGQSGHPLSNHYADQQPFWVEGKPMPLLSNTVTKRFELVTD